MAKRTSAPFRWYVPADDARVIGPGHTKVGRDMAKAYQVGAVVVAGALALAACGGSSSSGTGGGGGGKTVVISSDLPLQGASKDASDSTNNAIQLYLDQIGNKVGDYTIQFKMYDDSTAAAGQWDDAQCTKNANDHVNNPSEIAVMGTYNSGCAKIEVPILNQAPGGGMLMVSHANTNPGLTKAWDPGAAGEVLPDRQAQLRPRHHHRRLPGCRGRAVHGQGPRRQALRRDQRQPDVRPGRREGVRRRGGQAGHHGHSATRRGTPSSRTTPRSSRPSRPRTPTASTSAASTTTTVVS